MIFNVGVTDSVLFSPRLIDRAIDRYIIEALWSSNSNGGVPPALQCIGYKASSDTGESFEECLNERRTI